MADNRLVQWLRDAHAMESQAESMLTRQAERLEHYPELRARVQQHVEETQRQARLIESCLNRHGATTSSIKDTIGRTSALFQAVGGMTAGDEVLKGAMAGYTFEHFEISAYQILVEAADALGDLETREVCEGILREEMAMADWLRDHLPIVTRQFLQRENAGETAKV